MKIPRFLVLAPATLVSISGLSADAAARERRVPREYPTIQAAIDASVDGDSIRVAPGVYGESIRWTGKNIALIGAGAWATIVDPRAGPGGRSQAPAPLTARETHTEKTTRTCPADTAATKRITDENPSHLN